MIKLLIKFKLLLICLSVFPQAILCSNSEKETSHYHVGSYSITIKPDIAAKTISAKCDVIFKSVETDTIILYLDSRLILDSINNQHNRKIRCHRNGNKIILTKNQISPDNPVSIYYHGRPKISQNAPWDGGFVWSTDSQNHPFIGIVCQLEGSQLWWPSQLSWDNKPDNIILQIEVPKSLTAISNGILEEVKYSNENAVYRWNSFYPIEPYNLTIYIGDYNHIRENDDTMNRDYYILSEHPDLSIEYLKQVPVILNTLESYFGPYPFKKTGFKFIEAPYIGMEHQTAVGIGTRFMNGYSGFNTLNYPFPYDFYLIHETSHEWWGNSVSAKSPDDMWINESIATYSESLFIENAISYDSACSFLMADIAYLSDESFPIIDTVNGIKYNQNYYQKGSAIWHTFRSLINNDSAFFGFFKQMQKRYTLKSISTSELLTFIDEYFKKDYKWFFEFYLYKRSIPVLLIKKEGNNSNTIYYKWSSDDKDLPLSLKTDTQDPEAYLRPSEFWQATTINTNLNSYIKSIKNRYLIKIDLQK